MFILENILDLCFYIIDILMGTPSKSLSFSIYTEDHAINCLYPNTLITIGTQMGQVIVHVGNMEEVLASTHTAFSGGVAQFNCHVHQYSYTLHYPAFLNIDSCYGFCGYNPCIHVIFNKIDIQGVWQGRGDPSVSSS